VVAQRVIDTNTEMLQLRSAGEDTVYENKAFDEDQLNSNLPDFMTEATFVDQSFTLADFFV